MIENFKEIEMKQLVKADWNYKENDEDLVVKLTENIKRNGQIENIIVRLLDTGFYEIVNGNHRYDAMQAAEMEVAVCYDLGTISDARAKRIAVETNETRFPTDPVAFATVMDDILTEFDSAGLTATMPYSQDEINNFHDVLNFDWDGLGKGGGSGLELEGKKIVVTVDDKTMEQWFEWKQRIADLAHDDTNEEAFRILIDLGLRIDLAAEFVD